MRGPRGPRSGRRRTDRPVANGDTIVIDAVACTVDLLVDDATLAPRRADWKLPPPRYTSGVLAKFARLVTGAEKGAVTEA